MNQIICDGCNVRGQFEHRCHGKDRIAVLGELKDAACECQTCNLVPTKESLAEWAEAGHPDNFQFRFES